MADVVSTDPRTGQQIEVVSPETTDEEVDRICAAALTAAPALDELGRAGRARLLGALADALEAARDDVVAVADRETALGTTRLDGELTRTAYQLRLFAEVLTEGSYLEATIDHPGPSPMGPRPDLRRMLLPIGPVAVYAASNFPFAFSVPGGDTASALAAGCPVVLKAHPSHPQLSVATGAHVADALRQAGAPDGVFSVVTGFEAGIALVQHPGIRAASFTGSLRGGRALFDLAAARPQPIPFYGEMGSVIPAFVTPEAGSQRADEVAAGFVSSISLGNGQFCTKPGLLFVPAGAGLEDRVGALAGTKPAAPMLSDDIRSGYSEALAQLAQRPGVRLVAGEARPEGDPAPTILTATVP